MASTFVLDELDLDLSSARLLVSGLSFLVFIVAATLSSVGVVDETISCDDRFSRCADGSVRSRGVGGVHILRSRSLAGVW